MGTQPLSDLFETAKNLTDNLKTCPLLAAQLRDIFRRIHHLAQWFSELARALDHIIGGVPARGRVEKGHHPINSAPIAAFREALAALRRRAYPTHKITNLVNA